jgi:alanyl aminopeptidase
MLRFRVLLPVAFSCLAVAADQPPKLRLSEVQDVTPEKYRVELALDPQKDQFAGTIHIQLKVNRPTTTIWLNANRIAVESANVIAAARASLPGLCRAETTTWA